MSPLRPSQHGQAAAFADRTSGATNSQAGPLCRWLLHNGPAFSFRLDQAVGAELLTEDQHLTPAKVRAYGQPLIKVASSWVNSGGGRKLRKPQPEQMFAGARWVLGPHYYQRMPVMEPDMARGSRVGQRPASTWAMKSPTMLLNRSSASRLSRRWDGALHQQRWRQTGPVLVASEDQRQHCEADHLVLQMIQRRTLLLATELGVGGTQG
jgi:hypothetical protein